MDAVEQGLQFGRLVDHMHRRGYLAAIVQQRGYAQFVAILVGEREVGQRPFAGGGGRLRQHHGQFRHALAVAAGVGRLFVDGQVDQLDEGLEQGFQLRHQLPVAQGHRGLGGERFGQPLVGRRKGHDLAAGCVDGIDQLQHPDHFAFVVLHRHGQEGARTIAGAGIELAGAGKVEALRGVGVGNVDRIAGDGGVGGDHAIVGAAIGTIERQVRKQPGGGLGTGTAKGDVQRIGADDFEMQCTAVVGQQVEGAAVSPGNALGGEDDLFEQQLEVVLAG